MTIRILADREPYASYPTRFREMEDEKGPSGPFFIFSGPESVDGPPADMLVMPAEDFLNMPVLERAGSLVVAYGASSSMEAAFEGGCADYLREPWPLQELLVRARRILNPRVCIDGTVFSLDKDRLTTGITTVELTEAERRLARLLMLNAGLPVTREALAYALNGRRAIAGRSLDNYVSSLRGKMGQAHEGAGKAITVIRGVGYRLTSTTCG